MHDEVVITILGGKVGMLSGSRKILCTLVGDFFRPARVRRASNIWPYNRLLRGLYCIFRGVFGDEGWIASMLRKLPCEWIVDLRRSGGGLIGPYSSRIEAIMGEVDWLVEKF